MAFPRIGTTRISRPLDRSRPRFRSLRRTTAPALLLALAAGCGVAPEELPQGEPPREPEWDTESPVFESQSTHLFIVNRALTMLGRHTDVVNDPGARPTARYLDLLRTGVCRARWQQGLYDADFLAQYNDDNTWKSHFYDPTTGKNSEGETSGTALTEARAHFTSSIVSLSGGDWMTGCYELGLALHYFTDITQPMHAANFTAMSIPVCFHVDYESFVLGFQQSVPEAPWSGYPQMTYSLENDVNQAVFIAATTARPLNAVLKEKRSKFCIDLDTECWESPDHPAEYVGPETTVALTAAQQSTARFLWLFASYLAYKSPQPDTVSAMDGTWAAAAADASNVYWVHRDLTTQAGRLMRTSKTTGGTTLLAQRPGGAPGGIALASGSIFWTDAALGQVLKTSLDGSSTTVIASNQASPWHVAADTTGVYWINRADGTVMRWDGWTGSPPILLSDRATQSGGIALDDQGYLYFTRRDSVSASVARIDKKGLGLTELPFAGDSRPLGVAADGQYVYWADEGLGTLQRAAVSAGGVFTTTTVAQGGAPRSIALDGSDIYWTDPTYGLVLKTRKDGSSSLRVPVADGRPKPGNLVVSGKVYWAEDYTGTSLPQRGAFISAPRPFQAVGTAPPPVTHSLPSYLALVCP